MPNHELLDYIMDLEEQHRLPTISDLGWLEIFPEARRVYIRTLKDKIAHYNNVISIYRDWIRDDVNRKNERPASQVWFHELCEEIHREFLKEAERELKKYQWQLNSLTRTKIKATMGITDEDIARAKSVPIEAVYPGKLRQMGNKLVGLCHAHIEKSPSLYIYPKDNHWHCFGACNKGGDVIDMAMSVYKLNFKEAVRLLIKK